MMVLDNGCANFSAVSESFATGHGIRPAFKSKKTTCRLSFSFGAENGARTRDLNLGKVALYQLSYFRIAVSGLQI